MVVAYEVRSGLYDKSADSSALFVLRPDDPDKGEFSPFLALCGPGHCRADRRLLATRSGAPNDVNAGAKRPP